MKKILFISFILLTQFSWAQKANYLQKCMQEIQKSYEEHNQEKILSLVHDIYASDTILPDDAAFFLGYTLFKFEQYKASRTALLRYVQLSKEAGKYFDTTKYFINLIDEKLNQYDTNYCDICNILGPLPEMDTCATCHGIGKSSQKCHECRGSGIEVCPRCLGIGYERYQDSFQSNFYPCRVCNKAGTITCTVCKGTGTEINVCSTCEGEGKTRRKRICTHRDLVNATITPVKKAKTSSFYR